MQDNTPVGVDTTPVTPQAQELTRKSRTATLWTSLILFVIILLLVTIFFAQNAQQVTVSFFGFEGHLPLAVAMLFSAIAGALLVALAGAARMAQLHRSGKHIDRTAPYVSDNN